MRELSAEQTEAVKKRLAVLIIMSLDDLAALPSVTSEEVLLSGKKHTLSIWHDILGSGEHRVMVQLYQYGVLGVGQMYADGFVVNERNGRRALTQEEWEPFS